MSAPGPRQLLVNRILAGILVLPVLGVVLFFVASEWGEFQQTKWRWGYVDVTGVEVIPLQFEAARKFSHGRAAVRRDGLWGFIGPDGVLRVDHRFNRLCDYGGQDTTCAQDADGRWGYIDDSGEWEIIPRWDRANPMVDGIAVVGEVVGSRSSQISGSMPNRVYHFGLIDGAGTAVVPILEDDAIGAWTSTGTWSEGLLAVQFNAGGSQTDKFGYVDRTGTVILEPFYTAAKPFLNGFAAVSGGGGWAVINRKGTLILPEQSGLTDGASEGLLSGTHQYFSLEGEPVGEVFEWVRPHSDGLGAVRRNNRWGFADSTGSLVIDTTFRRVTPFSRGTALAAEADGLHYIWGAIDKTGAWVFEPGWDGVDEHGFFEGLIAVGRMPE